MLRQMSFSVKSLVARIAMFAMLLIAAAEASPASSLTKKQRQRRESDEITNGSLDMRLPARVHIAPFFIGVSPTLRELDEGETDAIRDITESVIEDSFRMQTSYYVESLSLSLKSSKWVPSRRTRRDLRGKRSSSSLPLHPHDKIRNLAVDADPLPWTILEISGGVAEFFLPINGVSPTEEQVSSIVKESIMIGLSDGLKQASLNRETVHDFSYVTEAMYYDNFHSHAVHVPKEDSTASSSVGKYIVLDEKADRKRSTPIVIGALIGALMVALIAALLVRKTRKGGDHMSHGYLEDDDAGIAVITSTGASEIESHDHKNPANINIGQCSNLDEYLGSRLKMTPEKKSDRGESPFGTPSTLDSSVIAEEDSLSEAASSEYFGAPSPNDQSQSRRPVESSEESTESFELQRTTSSLSIKKDMLFSASDDANLSDDDNDIDCTFLPQNLNQTRFAAFDPSDGRSVLKSTDFSASALSKSPLPMTTKKSFDVDACWNPDDNDADSVPSIDYPFTPSAPNECTREMI